MSETLQEIMEMVEVFWLDHEPDGWPAIRMDQVTALYSAVLAERAENERLRAALQDLADIADAYAADQSHATDLRVGLVQPVTVAEAELLNKALAAAWALLNPPQHDPPSLEDIFNAGLRKAPDADDVLDELRGRTEAKP